MFTNENVNKMRKNYITKRVFNTTMQYIHCVKNAIIKKVEKNILMDLTSRVALQNANHVTFIFSRRLGNGK